MQEIGGYEESYRPLAVMLRVCTSLILQDIDARGAMGLVKYMNPIRVEYDSVERQRLWILMQSGSHEKCPP